MRATASRALSNAFIDVFAVLRLAFTLKVDASRLVGRDLTIFLLGAIALALWLTLDALRFPSAITADLSHVPAIAAVAAFAVGLAWMLSRLAHMPIRHSLWLVAGYLPAVALAAWAFSLNVSRATLIALASVLSIHAALYFFFGLRALAGRTAPRAWAAFALTVAALLALNGRMHLDAGIWAPRQSPAEVARYTESQKRAEELLYAQPERIDAALRDVEATQSQQPRMYYLGFAGYGDQKVFAEEIELAARRVDERYDVTRRRVLLINDRRDFDSHPLASRAALERALRGIAARMDRERDILFLALSSHGKRNAQFVVTNAALPLNWLTGEALARMLRESGIRWKILVISACYAGAFIEPLRDDQSIIITASAADRTSFGCNPSRELTYFGEAFYRDALPRAPSLRAAFDVAAAQIREREQREGLEPSLPQAHFGAAMVAKLDAIERRR
jgi:hypothetical protein